MKDEISLTISKERYEDFITPFLDAIQDGNPGIFEVITRPAEGDLVYFPLGQRLFEVKFVEHEKPFYQLQKIMFTPYSVNSLNMKMRLLILLLMLLMSRFKMLDILQH